MLRVGAADEPSAKSIDQWRTIVAFAMQDRFAGLSMAGSEYLADFRITLHSSQDPPTTNDLKKLWEGGLLEVIVGSSSATADKTNLYLKLYIGSLKGLLDRDQLSMQQSIRADDVRSSVDGVALVTLYALAENAIQLSKSEAVCCPLLQQALYLINDLSMRAVDRRDGDSIQQLATVLRAPVSQRLEEKACMVHVPQP